jgi:O-antigen/teichoic acid export membrane protein
MAMTDPEAIVRALISDEGIKTSPISPPPRRTVERVGASVLTSVVRSGASLVAAVVLARGLGAHAYGDLTFLIATFTSLGLLLDSGSSMAFFTLLSMRPRARHFFTAYGLWTFGVQMAGTLIFLWLAPASVLSRAWEGESRGILILAFAAAFLSAQGWTSVIQIGEAQRRTFTVQVANAAQGLAHLALLGLAALAGRLSVATVLLLLILEYAVLMAVIAPSLVRMSLRGASVEEPWQEVVRGFVEYCRPVALYSYVGFLYGFADRWLLQHFGGAVQQGLFGFAQQFGTVSILATGAMMNVFWKEIAEARARGDLARLRELYMRSRRALFFTAAWTSCLLIPWSGRLLFLIVGSQYAAGAAVLTLMLLYPVHQSLGQLQGTFFIATGETRLYSTIGITWMSVSIVVTYFLLASPSTTLPGLGLGAVGLAGKLVGLQMIQVLIVGIIIARKYRWPYDLSYQFALLAGLLLTSFSIRWLIQLVRPGPANVAQIVTAVVIYAVVTASTLFKFPELAGFSHELVFGLLQRATNRIRGIR